MLARMCATPRCAPDVPAPRGPHEWDARRVLAAGDGGHAVVQVTGSDGRDFIVDAAFFESLPLADPEETSFVYVNPAGGPATYAVYGRFARLPETDAAR